jgi:hypothetical protein
MPPPAQRRNQRVGAVHDAPCCRRFRHRARPLPGQGSRAPCGSRPCRGRFTGPDGPAVHRRLRRRIPVLRPPVARLDQQCGPPLVCGGATRRARCSTVWVGFDDQTRAQSPASVLVPGLPDPARAPADWPRDGARHAGRRCTTGRRACAVLAVVRRVPSPQSCVATSGSTACGATPTGQSPRVST